MITMISLVLLSKINISAFGNLGKVLIIASMGLAILQDLQIIERIGRL